MDDQANGDVKWIDARLQARFTCMRRAVDALTEMTLLGARPNAPEDAAEIWLSLTQRLMEALAREGTVNDAEITATLNNLPPSVIVTGAAEILLRLAQDALRKPPRLSIDVVLEHQRVGREALLALLDEWE